MTVAAGDAAYAPDDPRPESIRRRSVRTIRKGAHDRNYADKCGSDHSRLPETGDTGNTPAAPDGVSRPADAPGGPPARRRCPGHRPRATPPGRHHRPAPPAGGTG